MARANGVLPENAAYNYQSATNIGPLDCPKTRIVSICNNSFPTFPFIIKYRVLRYALSYMKLLCFSGTCKEPSLAPQLHRIGVLTSRIDRNAGHAFERGSHLGRSATYSGTRRSRNRGFSMVELAVSLTVVLILTAIAVPTLMHSIRTYQLNSAAARVSDMLKFTRFEAVRRNKQINFLMQASVDGWIVGTDSDNNGTVDATEKQQLIAGFAALLPSGVAPSPTAISAALGGASLTPKSGSNGSVTFDARGAIRVGGTVSSSVFVFYLGSAADPQFGYRAVVLLPAGSTQVWTAPAGGTWQQIS